MILLIIFFIGTCFGSFSTVLIERWKSGKWGILLGRSECPSCHHTLSASELIPMFSYLFQRGKCKNCSKPISIFYPLAELFMWGIFVVMAWIGFSFWYDFSDVMWWIFIFWGFITGVYILYDIRYMEIPDQILVPGIYGTLLVLLAWLLWSEYAIFFDTLTYDTFHTFIFDHISAAIILYSFLYLQILIPWWWYLLRNKRKSDLLWLLISYFTFPFTLIIDIFRKKSDHNEQELEIPTWVGWWDLRVALFIGLTLGSIHGIASFLIAYIIGSVVGIFILAWNRKGKKITNTQIAFGPFLWFGWILSLLFYTDILNIINL